MTLRIPQPEIARQYNVVWSVLRSTRFPLTDEKETQADMATAFSAAGLDFVREHRLCAEDIPDFWSPSTGLTLEVKLNHAPRAAVLRQLGRYTLHPEVAAIVLASNRAIVVPDVIGGKPATFISLGAAWL